METIVIKDKLCQWHVKCYYSAKYLQYNLLNNNNNNNKKKKKKKSKTIHSDPGKQTVYNDWATIRESEKPYFYPRRSKKFSFLRNVQTLRA
jgi:hypothetical protein